LKIARSAAMSELHKGKIVSEDTRQKLREKNKNYRPAEDAKRRSREAQIGHKTSEETKKKISISNTGGKSRKGQVWMTNGIENTSIYPEHIQDWLTRGWRKGRSAFKK